ncbi:unnamed protein product [Trichobilharzia szidati]|nr:unnamed protein product [Trichobilharzia szidati]CAH8841527.1 unnamed protein product [Trichobilharzia szidati]
MVQSSSWVDLWDRASEFIKYHDNGINIHERLYKFLIEFAKLQKEAFIAQKRLCEKHLNDAQKYFGVSNSYVSFFNELVQIVQHIIDAENLISCSFEIHASNEGKSVIEDERRQFKRWKRERSKLSSELKSQTRIIDDEIKRYRDKYRDMIKAKDDYERINADQSHSQFDVEKALSYARLKEVDFERARKDYSAALDQFNLYRKDYYFRCLPLWAQVGKDLETVRYTRTQSLISILYERLRVAIDRMTTVCSEFQAVSTHLNSDQDAEEIINFLRSNNAPPGDIDFVDLSSASLPSSSGPQTSITSTNNVKSNIGLTSEPIYSSGSVVLPANFHCSVWAADHAGGTGRGGGGEASINKQYNPPSGEAMIYGESGSTYSASYASTTASTTNGPTNGSLGGGGGSMNSRRPSVSDHFAVPNPRHPSQQLYASNGAGFFRRIFSRRSRSVVNLKTIADLCDPNRVKRQGTFHQTNGEYNPVKPGGHKSRSRDNIVIDTSDFSDSCSDFENDEVHSQPIIQPPTEEVTPSTAIQMNSLPNNNENIAYATTSVLNGLPNSIPSQYPPSLSDIASLPSHHPSFDTQGATSSSSKDKLSIPLHYFAAMAKTSVAIDNNGNNNNNTNGKYLKNEGKSCSSAPLAEPETASTVTSSTSSRPTSTSSSLNGQILPSVKQNLAAVKSNNNTKYHSVNGNAAYNCVNDSNHNDKDSTAAHTFMYSHMNSSYNHHQQHSEGKSSHQILYDQHKNMLKRHEQQRLWLLQQDGGQQQQQQKEQSLQQQHQQQQQHRSSRAPDNSDTSSTLSVSYHSNSSSSNNNNNNRDKNSSGKESSQIVVIGDCTALYSFTADGFESCYLAFEANEKFYILSSDPTEDTTDWLHVCRMQQQQQQHPFEIGYVPTAYVQQQLYSQPILLPNNHNTKHEPTQDSSDSSSTTKTATTTATPKRPATTIPISTTHNGQIKSSGSNNNSTVSNRSNMNPCMMNRNFRGTSPYVRLSGVSRDTDL